MARDIGDLLADAVDERAHALGDLRPTPAAFALTRVRIRRRRIVRHSLEAGAGVAASGAIATGVWFGLDAARTSAPPAGTISPAPEPSVAPTGGTTSQPAPAPTSSDATTAGPTVQAEPIVEPGLPSGLPVPADLVDRTGPGWVLALYRSTPSDPPDALTVTGVYAVAPDGTRYRLADPPERLTVDLLGWRAGDARARVLFRTTNLEEVTVGWLDLRTGAVEADPVQPPTWSGYVARADDGTEVWVDNTEDGGEPEVYAIRDGQTRQVGVLAGHPSRAVASPSVARVAALTDGADRLVALDVASGDRREVDLGVPGGECVLLGWLDEASVLVSCFDHGPAETVVDRNPRLVRVDVDARTVTTVRQLGVGDPFAPTQVVGANVRPGVVAFPAYPLAGELPVADVCPTSAWEWSSSDGLRQLVAPSGQDELSVGAAIAATYVAAEPHCGFGLGASALSRVAADGAVTEVVPAPADAADRTTGLSWVVAR